MKDWRTWVLIGLVALNLFTSAWAAARPVVPVAALTNAIVSLGGDARVLLLRVQQLEQALQQAQAELAKAKGRK